MKVIFCAYDRPGYIGGPNVGLRRLLPDLRAAGVDARCFLLTFGSPGECPTLQGLTVDGVPCRYAAYHKSTDERVRWLLHAAREEEPELFVPNLMPAAYFASRWLRRAGIPTVGVLRSIDAFHEGFLEEFASGRPEFRQTAFVGVSSLAVDLIRCANADLAAIEQIPSPVRVPVEAVNYKGGPFRVMYSGRLVEHPKRASTVARAFCDAARQTSGIEFSIYGDGPDRDKAEEVISSHGQELPVFMAGRVESQRMSREISAHHAIVLMSEYEGMPLALMEGMGAGLVPVCTNGRGGVSELVDDGDSGFIVSGPGQEFISALSKLRDDHELYQRLSRAARQKILNTSSCEVVTGKWINLFKRIAGAEGPKRRITVPLHLGLPPPNSKIASEDDRIPVFFSLIKVVTCRGSRFTHGESAPFVAPRCTPTKVDIYTVRKLILRALCRTLPAFKGIVADVGAGRAPYRNLVLAAPGVRRYITLDLPGNPYSAPDVIWDGQDLPLEDSSVDTVMATEVLEHCPDPALFLDEVTRIIKPGGVFFITVPFLWPLHDIPHDEYRYTPWSLERLLLEAGYSEIRIRSLGGYEAALAQMIGLWARRRSLGRTWQRYLRPIASALSVPLVWALTRFDQSESSPFREGLMITGLCATAMKGDPR